MGAGAGAGNKKAVLSLSDANHTHTSRKARDTWGPLLSRPRERRIFLKQDTEGAHPKSKIDKSDFIKIKNLCLSKDSHVNSKTESHR